MDWLLSTTSGGQGIDLAKPWIEPITGQLATESSVILLDTPVAQKSIDLPLSSLAALTVCAMLGKVCLGQRDLAAFDRNRTRNVFYEAMSAQNNKKAFKLVVISKPS